MDLELSDFYQELYGLPLAEPRDDEDMKNILSCIRAQHGFFDDEDKNQLQKTSSLFQKKMTMAMSKARKFLAQLTTTISEQLYDDPFRFFFELIQNADDAKFEDHVVPEITFTVFPEELLVDINEKGFTLADVISICATSQSSKKLDERTTGEKGFGFKAVFGIADRVHVQSGLWSFCFEHKAQDDGLGMITPIWQQPRPLPDHIGTRFRLRYASLDPDSSDSLEQIWTQFESQHPSLIFALRKLGKVCINLENVNGRNQNICFEKISNAYPAYITIKSSVSGKSITYHYRTFIHTINDMPTLKDRPNPASTIKIGFPVSAVTNGLPKVEKDGQFIFAFLPVMRVKELPFLIHADFILVGSRQSVIINTWNRKLRDEVAGLFVRAVKHLVREEAKYIAYQWPVYVPQPMDGLWRDLPLLIKQSLLTQELFYGLGKTLRKAEMVRILPSVFKHQGRPLLSESKRDWQFLSVRYESCSSSILESLGVRVMSTKDALRLIEDDTSRSSPSIYTTPLKDDWHDAFLAFVHSTLNKEEYKIKINRLPIIPVCGETEKALQWQAPGQDVYWPIVVDEKTPSERITIRMPTDLDIVVLHPDAADKPSRREVYVLLGVRTCPLTRICNAIERVQRRPGRKDDDNLLRHFELLFWFSHPLRDGANGNLIALNARGIGRDPRVLFMRSSLQYHAESLLKVSENWENLRDNFLAEFYQSSSVSSRTRGGMSWEQWLCNVAGVRWYPSLWDPNNLDKLHWAVETIRDNNPKAFLPMIQHYWANDYSKVCCENRKIKKALMQSKVLCQRDGLEELRKTWFPNRKIVEAARKYGVQHTLPILALPGPLGDPSISQWPCLTDLGVRWMVDLSFYRETLVLISRSSKTLALSTEDFGLLYKDMGDRATIEDQETLRTEFEIENLVWDPESKRWCPPSDCVWESRIPLRSRFVLTSQYDKSTIHGLFQVHIEVDKVTQWTLVEELSLLKEDSPSQDRVEVLECVIGVYSWLADMVQATEDQKLLRSAFMEKALIYNSENGNWLKPCSCVWHTSIAIGDHFPIAAQYAKLEALFVTILGVSTVTDVFMMKQLAAAANKKSKTPEEIKGLMMSTSEVLKSNTKSHEFSEIVSSLKQSKYLPCKSPAGEEVFCSRDDSFFIADNQYYAESFGSKLTMLDFTYEQLVSLHELFRMLRIDHRYLTRHVFREASAKTSSMDNTLTEQFRQCAYALSCCAIAHRSPLFSTRNQDTYNKFATIRVHTSGDISTKLVVQDRNSKVEVECGSASLIVKQDQDVLQVTLPLAKVERQQAMRSQLPGKLSDLLEIIDSRGEKQIYRILNELESGTDEIMLDEDISRVSWLRETCRPAPPPTPPLTPTPTPPTEIEADYALPTPALPGPAAEGGLARHAQSWWRSGGFERVIPIMTDPARSDLPPSPPPPYISPLERPDSDAVPPDYWKVLDHVRVQAMRVESASTPTTESLINQFASLSLRNVTFDPKDYTRLFGANEWLSKFLLGAAGELFAYEMLRDLTSNRLRLEHWQSSIRHHVQAHRGYSHVTRLVQRETADLVYVDDNNNSLGRKLKSRVVGDAFQEWCPDWLASLGEDGDEEVSQPIEWLFEIKTTTGACETEFFMSPGQYELMESLSVATGSQHNSPQSQSAQDGATTTSTNPLHGSQYRPPRPRTVYCIIRVYNLLAPQIGFRLYIDPWRLRGRQLQFSTDKWKVRSVTG